jgi:two-component system, chemotaxis family, protein-glutamate methylesterase/glutaminase
MPESRDIIVLGGSAGALDALKNALRGVDADIPAAIFIVIHSGQAAPGLLAKILGKVTQLEVRYAEDREPIELGNVYIAPPDRHLIIKPGEVRVVRGPKENNFRPAIDPLFRSAAYTYGQRVVGVVVSGMLDDGSHGLFQIKQQGGVAVAQSIEDAQQPSMPMAAIRQVGVDYVLPAAEIGPLLNDLARPDGMPTDGPYQEQADVAEGLTSGLRVHAEDPHPSSPFICPACGGALWEVHEGELVHYRCHVGHGFTTETLRALQNDELEQALWTSVRLLEEQAELQNRMANRWQTPGTTAIRERFESNAVDRLEAADLIRRLLLGRQTPGQLPDPSPNLRHEYGA